MSWRRDVNRNHLGMVVCLSGAVLAGAAFALPGALERDDLPSPDIERVRSVTKPAADFSAAEKFEARQGGAATSKKIVNRDAFSHPSANLTFEEEQRFKIGNALFRKLWVSAPSSVLASDGLGPMFNARACQNCHIKDGRGHPPEGDGDATSMVLRLARSARTQEETFAAAEYRVLNFPDPVYGRQLQDRAVASLRPEGRMEISYTEHPVQLEDGSVVSLRRPHYSIADLAYGALHPDTVLSPRVAGPMIGLGLVEAIHPADIFALADEDDADGDGISGRAALARDLETGEIVLGRFGWKAQNPSVRAQTTAAFSGDMGLSTPDIPDPFGDCTQEQPACFSHPTGVQEHLGNDEAPEQVVELVTFYSRHLAVPARRDVNDPEVLRGKRLFYESGCSSCHTPKFVTRRDEDDPALSFQLIWPYSDFLLHDMGEGLADGQTVGAAGGREWRTPPLWGIGLTKTVSGHTFFLHDGRARNLTEAILWHGGEGEESKRIFRGLNKADREALIRFLESL